MSGTAFSLLSYRRHLLLLGYLVLAAALSIQRGSYSLWSLGLALAALCMTLSAVWPYAKRPEPLRSTDVLMGVLFLLMLGLTDFPVTYPGSFWFGTVTHIGWIVCGILLAAVYLPRPHASARLRNGIVLATAAFALALQCWLPFMAPDPHIDVFTVQQESSANLYAGKNPFTTRVGNPYEGMNLHLTYDVGSRFAYPPSALAGAVVGYTLFGDVRFLYVLCNLFIAWVLRRMLRPAGAAGELVPLLWLLHPQGLLFIGQSWTEPLIIAGFALTALAQLRKNAWLTAVSHGFTMSLKQYLVITVPLLLVLERRWKLLALSAVAAIVTAVPFLMWNAGAVWGSMFAVIVPLRDDSLSLSALLLTFGIRMQTWMTVCIGAGAALALTWLLRKADPLHAYLAVAGVSLFTMFLFGTQGFLNYYLLVSGILLLLLAEMTARQTARG
ncbi:MAG TPA: hypothetical protein PKV72_05465 [Candidatus Peribacteria bacterium]|nr:hypothetical protein [Candidatus Peribacteria bacterium]